MAAWDGEMIYMVIVDLLLLFFANPMSRHILIWYGGHHSVSANLFPFLAFARAILQARHEQFDILT